MAGGLGGSSGGIGPEAGATGGRGEAGLAEDPARHLEPVSSWARVISVGVAMVGPIYIAVVMGVLISRITASQTTKEVEEFEEQRDLLR
jgi:hypothetical protein